MRLKQAVSRGAGEIIERAARCRLGRPDIERTRVVAKVTSRRIIGEIEALAMSTDLRIRQVQGKIGGQASRGIVGEITERVRAIQRSA